MSIFFLLQFAEKNSNFCFKDFSYDDQTKCYDIISVQCTMCQSVDVDIQHNISNYVRLLNAFIWHTNTTHNWTNYYKEFFLKIKFCYACNMWDEQ